MTPAPEDVERVVLGFLHSEGRPQQMTKLLGAVIREYPEADRNNTRFLIGVLVRNGELRRVAGGRFWPKGVENPCMGLSVSAREEPGQKKRQSTAAVVPEPGLQEQILSSFAGRKVLGMKAIRRSVRSAGAYPEQVKEAVALLYAEGRLLEYDGLFTLPENSDALASRRIAAKKEAARLNGRRLGLGEEGDVKSLSKGQEALRRKAGLGPLTKPSLRVPAERGGGSAPGAHPPAEGRPIKLSDLNLPKHDWLVDD